MGRYPYFMCVSLFLCCFYSCMCLQVTFQVLGTACSYTSKYNPLYSSSTFISGFEIDLLSIRKVIIFPEVATADRSSKVTFYTKMLQICRSIHFCYYCATGGEGYSSAHVHVITCDPLPVVQAACLVRR